MEDVTNEVLLERVDNLIKENGLAHESIVESVKELSEHVKKTNGQVVSLRLSRSWMYGFMACVSAIVIPMAVYLLTEVIK